MLNEKFDAIITFFQLQNFAFKVLVNSRDDFTLNTPKTSDLDREDEILNEPIEIDFIQKKDFITDVITTKCKIKRLVILNAIVDLDANFSIMTNDIAKQLKLKININKRHNLKGVITVSIELLNILQLKIYQYILLSNTLYILILQ